MLSRLAPNLWFYAERNDLNEVGRRALVQILALRIWQLEHGGKLPESLDDLVPDLLPKLPTDPYSMGQKPFRYTVTATYSVPPLGEALSASRRTMSVVDVNIHGYGALYSVGINMHDDQAKFHQNLPGSSENDIIFPLKYDVGKKDGGPNKPAG